MTIALTTIVEIALAATFAIVAFALAFRPPVARPVLARVRSGIMARLTLGLLALLPAGAMIVAIAIPFVAFFAAAYAAVTAVGLSMYVGLRGYTRAWLAGSSVVAVCLLVSGLQPLGLRVLCLPRADQLPYEPVAEVRVVKTYDEGVWFEGIQAGSDGTLYLAANIGLDFSRTDYYRGAHGEVISRLPNGEERVLFKTPTDSTAGIFAINSDGSLFMTSHGVTSGIWRIMQNGHSELFARLPASAWPNGLDFGPDGKLYAADSSLGLVWRIDPANGAAEIALKHPALSARPFIALAPGANGLHFHGRDMLVTVSDSTKVLRFRMNEAGTFGEPDVVATGIPGDDFAVGADGTLFITTHPYNTLVRVAPDGRRSVIADARQRIIGATDAAFGRTEADRDILYVVTDGGAFTGGPGTRGELIALRLPAPR
jgi:sugar lactone lactonase YvrE